MKTAMTTTNNRQRRDIVPVILVRHAQSEWNRQNRFSGWANPALTAAGVAEAHAAGRRLRQQGYLFDVAWSSRLQRAVSTLDILLEETGCSDIPTYQDWRLNERHYGVLQGVNKAEAAALVGEQQVWRWRRSYRERATPLLRTDPAHPLNDELYRDVEPVLLPGAENLAQTRMRVAMFWQQQVVPRILEGERVLLSAHGNTLRALLMELSGMSVEEVEAFEIPTAAPIVYQFDREAASIGWGYLDDNHAMESMPRLAS